MVGRVLEVSYVSLLLPSTVLDRIPCSGNYNLCDNIFGVVSGMVEAYLLVFAIVPLLICTSHHIAFGHNVCWLILLLLNYYIHPFCYLPLFLSLLRHLPFGEQGLKFTW